MTSCSRMASLLLTVVALALLLPTYSEAKRGCASFGHSCFGGHGKRAEVAEEAAPLSSILPLDPMDIQAMQFFRQLCTLQPQQYMRMAPIFRRLAETYTVEAEEPLPRK